MLESELWPHLTGKEAEDVLSLLVRGRQLFTTSKLSAKVSFRQLIESCDRRKLLPRPTLLKLTSLADRFLPPGKGGFLALKSYIYQCIMPVQIRQPDLKPDALKELLRAKPTYMKTIPGFTPPLPRSRGFTFPERDRWRNAVAKSSPLAHLIDHSSFQKFSFLRVTS